jgi:hypothetical protein
MPAAARPFHGTDSIDGAATPGAGVACRGQDLGALLAVPCPESWKDVDRGEGWRPAMLAREVPERRPLLLPMA